MNSSCFVVQIQSWLEAFAACLSVAHRIHIHYSHRAGIESYCLTSNTAVSLFVNDNLVVIIITVVHVHLQYL